MRLLLSRILLKSVGWKHNVTVEIPEKCVICVAPHTSNWDFIIGELFYTSIGKTASFLIKDSWFIFPINYLLKSLGGIPVNRERSGDLTSQLAHEFKRRKRFHLAVTPEGTRKLNPKWKKGFYQIAMKAEVPITLIYMDYMKKEIGTLGVFHPTGNEDEDIRQIKLHFKDVKACHPENFTIGDI